MLLIYEFYCQLRINVKKIVMKTSKMFVTTIPTSIIVFCLQVLWPQTAWQIILRVIHL